MSQVMVNVPRPLVATAGRPAPVVARLEAIDWLRGVVMVLMALDHVRDAFSNARFNLMDLERTTPALFLTRWITHFCAPVFVFLAGTGAYLAATRGKTRRQVAWFLLTRGLWLVVLEFTLVRFGWFFNFDYHVFVGQVIWAIGGSMIVLAGLVFLPTWVVTVLGVMLIAGHNAFDGVSPDRLGALGWLWTFLMRPGAVELRPGIWLFVGYPLLPWLGVLLVGYGSGVLWLLEPRRRQRWLFALGAGATLVFIVLRSMNEYGDPQPWRPQSAGLFSAFAFLNCAKYPPSLFYVLMTLGPALLLLAARDRALGRRGRWLVTFGRVPLFFYLLHLPLIHLLALTVAWFRYPDVGFMFQNIFMGGAGRVPAGYGFGLPVVYGLWLVVVLLLYPPCAWFADLKGRRRSVWLSYL
jgi:uncharacterized membrane protein